MVPLVGYLERISGRPCDRVGVKVSSQVREPYAADFVRIIYTEPFSSLVRKETGL
jgi:hypothetical protein